jgi:oxygen-dependent protoporphyrinogen oxidase
MSDAPTHAQPASDGPRVAVVGGGVSGLAAAFHLARCGCSVELIERDSDLGGRLGPGMLGERAVMLGGKNIGRRYTSLRGFIGAFGHHPFEAFGINASRVEHGTVRTLDSTRRARTARNALGVGSPRDLLRLAGIAARVHRDPANRFLDSPLSAALGARYDRAPVSAHFGEKLTRNLLRPMGIRSNGAEPDELYLGNFPTNLGLLMDTYDQLQHGIQPVLEAFARRVPTRLETLAHSVMFEDGRVSGLSVTEAQARERERAYDGVVVATTARAAAQLVRDLHAPLAGELEHVSYFAGAVALVEYDRPVFNAEVRALALDDGPCSNAGSYGINDRHIVRYTFSGREARQSLAAPELRETWIDQAEQRLREHIPIAGAQRVHSVSRNWSTAYCGYVPEHARFLARVRASLAELPGLTLAGDYLLGSSLEACFRSGTDAAVALLAQLRQRPPRAPAPALPRRQGATEAVVP